MRIPASEGELPFSAGKAYELEEAFHGDPADRVITATALVYDLTLVTSDRKLLAYAPPEKRESVIGTGASQNGLMSRLDSDFGEVR